MLLLACKATLILGLVAGIFVLAGRRWPQKCLLCQRLGVTALLALPVAGWALPTVGVPVLSAPRPITIDEDAEHARQLAAPVRQVAGGETASRRNPSAAPEASSTASALHGLPPSNMSIAGLFLAAAYGVVLAGPAGSVPPRLARTDCSSNGPVHLLSTQSGRPR